MDANRFDTLARTLTGTRSRRSAIGSLLAGGVLGALGLSQQGPALVAAQGGGLCVIDFQAIVRQGPSATRSLAPGGSPGTLRGYMRYSLSGSGNLEGADLLLDDGSSLPVVGQATGYGFQARVELGQGQALVAVGVGEEPISRCLGRIDGTLTGTEVGDLGEWHAVAGVQNLPGGASPSGSGGNRPASGSSGTASRPVGSSSATNQGSSGSRPNSGNSSTSGESSNSEFALACPEGETRCDGVCVNVRTDVVNCGQCGVTCASELGAGSCLDGICGCAPGTSRCNGICVNTDRDPLNCGRCGNACPAGLNCFIGKCTDGVQPCLERQERCGDACADVATDAANCGRCGNVCRDGEECRNGSCPGGEATCPEGETRCSGTCVNTTSDVFNCGVCGRICALEEACTGGKCLAVDDDDDGDEQVACPAEQIRCAETCTDLQTDETNCGACGTTCAAGEECVAGKCTPPAQVLCPEGQVRCDGTCRDALPNFGTEGLSCPSGGGAPTECPAGRVLCNGACFPEGTCQPTECQTGWGYCYGLCRDFQNDPGYCGGCNTPCTGGAYCREGKCFYCSDEFTPCGDKCVDTRTDLDNCGGCGSRCGTQCIDGRCTEVGPAPLEACPDGQTRCNGTCVDTTKDNANCGTCGNVCGENKRCAAQGNGIGYCFISNAYCASLNLVGCAYKCADLVTDPDNCGECFNKCGTGTECRDKRCVRTETPATAQTLIGEDAVAPPESELVTSAVEPEPVFSCPEGQTDCGGVCADLGFNESNCGSCGFVCGSDSVCERGVCVQNAPPPSAPEEEVVTEPAPEEIIAESAPEEAAPACVEVGGACDPAAPGGCCSGVCNEDGTCA